MIISFKKRFVLPILDGAKIHTIREDNPNRWKQGNTIHFATGVRTKNYNQFHKGICTSVQSILLVNHGNHVYCRIQTGDNSYIHNDCVEYKTVKWFAGHPEVHLLDVLCDNDGLTWVDFKQWFVPNEGDKFTGKIIHWTAFRYMEQEGIRE